jgi:hypothetical protein
MVRFYPSEKMLLALLAKRFIAVNNAIHSWQCVSSLLTKSFIAVSNVIQRDYSRSNVAQFLKTILWSIAGIAGSTTIPMQSPVIAMDLGLEDPFRTSNIRQSVSRTYEMHYTYLSCAEASIATLSAAHWQICC